MEPIFLHVGTPITPSYANFTTVFLISDFWSFFKRFSNCLGFSRGRRHLLNKHCLDF